MSQAVTVVLYCLTLRKSVSEHGNTLHVIAPCHAIRCASANLTCDTDYRTLQCLASLLASGPRAVMSCPTGNHVKPASLSALQGVALPGCPAWRKKKPDFTKQHTQYSPVGVLAPAKVCKREPAWKGNMYNCINTRLRSARTVSESLLLRPSAKKQIILSPRVSPGPAARKASGPGPVEKR